MNRRRRRTRYKDAYNAASKFKEAEFGGRSSGNFDVDIETANQNNKNLPKGSLRGIATPPPGYEFTEDNKLIKSGGRPLPQDAYGGRGGSKP